MAITHADLNDLLQLKKETESTVMTDPFRVVDIVIEIQNERRKVTEALNARDAAVHRLVEAYESINEKAALIEQLQKQIQQEPRGDSPFPFKIGSSGEKIEDPQTPDSILLLERTINRLRDGRQLLTETQLNFMNAALDLPPSYDEEALKKLDMIKSNSPQPPPVPVDIPRPLLSPALSQNSLQTSTPTPKAEEPIDSGGNTTILKSDEPQDMIKARNAILAALPLPKEVPEDTLSPLSIPATFTLQEFLSSMSGPLRTSLVNYRLFYALTTLWCPEREEHGYFYAPVFKCSTNPRVATAHRWTAVDVIARMNKPTECFFNKDGTWYYAGIYKAFLMDNLNVKEWSELPTETAQAIVKDTISARKNTSPQNVYEVTQLYAAGALKVACVGLQCVGFNNTMYKALLEQANKFALTKWKAMSPAPLAVVGLGTGSVWNSTIGGPTPDIVDTLGNMNLGRQGTDMNENIPIVKR